VDTPNPFAAPEGPPDPEEPAEGAPWRVVVIQAAAFLLYQVPAN